jgi:hypothetical protein
MANRTLFLAEITDGYSLRNTICMIKNEQDQITLLISKDKIKINFVNKGQHAFHDLYFNTVDFHDYIYNIPNREEYAITVNTSELFNATKPVGRKDSLKISLKEGNEKLSIQPIKSSKDNGRSSVSFINIINKDPLKYDLLNHDYSNDPCIKMPNREFSDICSQASTQKCSYLEITACNNTITFKGVLPDGSYGMVSRFMANRNDEDKITKVNTGKGQLELNIIDSEEITIKLPQNSVKTFAKLHNIAPTGAELKFMFGIGKPIKIESKIGSYGGYCLYLRDYKIVN